MARVVNKCGKKGVRVYVAADGTLYETALDAAKSGKKVQPTTVRRG